MRPAPCLAVRNVSKVFGGIRALSGVSFEVPAGEIVGIIGPNGAGKTTMFNLITGAYKADRGQVLLSGEEVSTRAPYQIARAGISRTFQNIRLFGDMTVWDHMLVAQPLRGAVLDRFLPSRWSDPAATHRAREVLQFFGLESFSNRVARSLPYGLQRKVEMARAVTSQPKLLLLDEPIAGMNHDEATEIRQIVLRLRDEGLSILLIEHDMPFVMNLCSYLYVLDFGSMIAEGRPDEVRNNPVVLDAYLGRADNA